MAAKEVYSSLLRAYGPQGWWPADGPFEVIVGAILTQNTNWSNVEKAIANLRKKGALHPEGLKALSPAELAEMIRPSGYFNIKAKRLKNFIDIFFDEFSGDLGLMFSGEQCGLRRRLLQVSGIGPETADSILLYAGGYPFFVVDAYTKRIFSRLGLIKEEDSYHQVQEFFTSRLGADAGLFNEYHALIVRHAKERCRKRPLCEGCPLTDVPCEHARTLRT